MLNSSGIFSKIWIGKDAEGGSGSLILSTILSWNLPGISEGNYVELSQDSECPNWDVNCTSMTWVNFLSTNSSEKGEQRIKGINIEKLYKKYHIFAHSSCELFLVCGMNKIYYCFSAIQKVALCTIVFFKQMGWCERDLTQMLPRWSSAPQVDT